MICSSFILMLSICIICSFCGKDFVTLGRHSWRCKQRVHDAEQDHFAENAGKQMPAINSPIVISSHHVIKCCCGKVCKGARGLKMYQCSCRVIHDLNTELYSDMQEQGDFETENIPEMDQCNQNEASTAKQSKYPRFKERH